MHHKFTSCLMSSHSPASWLRCLLPWVMVWVLSGVGAVWGCVRVLYLWEPVTPLHSPKSVSFWRHRKQADLNLKRVCVQHIWNKPELCLWRYSDFCFNDTSKKGQGSVYSYRKIISQCGCSLILLSSFGIRLDVFSPIEEHFTHFVLMSQFRLLVPCMGLFLVFVKSCSALSHDLYSSHLFLSGFTEYFQLTVFFSLILSPAGWLHSSNGQFGDLPVSLDQSSSLNQSGPSLLAVLESDPLLLASSGSSGLACSPDQRKTRGGRG